MRAWLDEYKNLMGKTRYIGIAGAALMVLGAALDLYKIFVSLSLAEVSLFDNSDLRWDVGKSVILLLIVISVFILRIIILSYGSAAPYYKFVGSWFLVVAIGIAYVWMTGPSTPSPGPDCSPPEGKGCFGIYEMRSLFTWVRLMGVLYPTVSALRSLATGLCAAFKYQYK